MLVKMIYWWWSLVICGWICAYILLQAAKPVTEMVPAQQPALINVLWIYSSYRFVGFVCLSFLFFHMVSVFSSLSDYTFWLWLCYWLSGAMSISIPGSPLTTPLLSANHSQKHIHAHIVSHIDCKILPVRFLCLVSNLNNVYV